MPRRPYRVGLLTLRSAGFGLAAGVLAACGSTGGGIGMVTPGGDAASPEGGVSFVCGSGCAGPCDGGTCVKPVALTAHSQATCALLSDGTVACWGAVVSGVGSSSKPTFASGIRGATAVGLSSGALCAILGDKTVDCVGSVTSASGAGTSLPIPTAVPGLTGVDAIAVGTASACALVAQGTIECWGDNQNGELGNGAVTPSEPLLTTTMLGPVPALAGVTAIAANFSATCAVLSGGTVQCWGALITADGGIANVPRPETISGVTGAIAVGTGQEANHWCAVLRDGSVECWGDDTWGQLGDGNTSPATSPRETVPGVAGAVAVAAGLEHTCALLAGGTVLCWGDNDYGQLGNAATLPTGSMTPVAATGVTGAVAITAGGFHTCALLADGTIECWGQNAYGELGNGGTSPNRTFTPVAVTW